MRILVADDAGFIRAILCKVYEDAGHQIVGEATTGPEAIALAMTTRPDIAIIDLVLPELNGLEVAAEISKHSPALTLIALSSLDQPWIADKVKQAGFSDFIRKPFTKEDVLSVLELVYLPKKEIKHG